MNTTFPDIADAIQQRLERAFATRPVVKQAYFATHLERHVEQHLKRELPIPDLVTIELADDPIEMGAGRASYKHQSLLRITYTTFINSEAGDESRRIAQALSLIRKALMPPVAVERNADLDGLLLNNLIEKDGAKVSLPEPGHPYTTVYLTLKADYHEKVA